MVITVISGPCEQNYNKFGYNLSKSMNQVYKGIVVVENTLCSCRYFF